MTKEVAKEEEFVNEEGWRCLAAAVIRQACDDYRISILVNDERNINAIEKFFRSKYFHSISTIDPEWLIANLKEKYKAEKAEMMKRKERKHG